MISPRLKQRFYGDVKYNGTEVFYRWLREQTAPAHRVLNLGAGPTPDLPVRSLRGEVAEVIGADVDPVVFENSAVDRAILIKDGQMALSTASIDLAYSDYVLEHVERPKEFLAEVLRVLKPGGSFLFRTPNIVHYVGLISLLTPHSVHKLIANPVRGLCKDAHDPWPTFYRMNSRPKLRRLAREAGFTGVELRMIEANPSYLEFHPVPFLLGVAYERVVNSHPWLSGLRANIFGRFLKSEAAC
jgi:SAM-dependent methyltransferase